MGSWSIWQFIKPASWAEWDLVQVNFLVAVLCSWCARLGGGVGAQLIEEPRLELIIFVGEQMERRVEKQTDYFPAHQTLDTSMQTAHPSRGALIYWSKRSPWLASEYVLEQRLACLWAPVSACMCETRLQQQMDTCSRANKVCGALLVLACNMCGDKWTGPNSEPLSISLQRWSQPAAERIDADQYVCVC